MTPLSDDLSLWRRQSTSQLSQLSLLRPWHGATRSPREHLTRPLKGDAAIAECAAGISEVAPPNITWS